MPSSVAGARIGGASEHRVWIEGEIEEKRERETKRTRRGGHQGPATQLHTINHRERSK